MSVNNQSTIVDKAVVMDAFKDIGINVAMAASDKHSSLKLKLVLLSALLLLLMSLIGLRFVLFTIVVFSCHASEV